MNATRANVWTVAAGSPFLKTLVSACQSGALGFGFSEDPRDYSKATIYVPTRRAARALAHAFAEALQPRSVLLPRIIPLGDPADLEERAILSADSIGLDDGTPPAIEELERRLVLTTLVEHWRKSGAMQGLEARGDGFTLGGGFSDSFSLAGELASLIDEFTVEAIDWRRLGDLPHEAYDKYWSMTRSFLEIAGEAWPAYLKEQHLLDPAERLNSLLRNEAARLKAEPTDHPVIAAGSTGTVPATAELLGVIARLPKGAVILPGLDLMTDARGWQLIAERSVTETQGSGASSPEAQSGHPQTALKRLLHFLRIERPDVKPLAQPDTQLDTRAAIIHAASRAAEATDDWPAMRNALQDRMTEGLRGLCIVNATDEREEALAVAIALRETLEDTGKTAALITPDRALAQRVAIELKRWGIVADDSSGQSLGQMPLGSFARLILHCLRQDFAQVPVMALLTHPCLDLGLEPDALAEALSALELAGARTGAGVTGLAGLSSVLDDAEKRVADRHSSPPVRRLSAEALAQARHVLGVFVAAMQDLEAMRASRQRLAAFAAAHDRLLEALAGARAVTGADALALGKVMDTLMTTSSNPEISFEDYIVLFETLLAESIVPPSRPVQGRIKIWGLLEARLMVADRVVLGGLNEKTWPPDVRSDPFLNRGMRAALGLSSPERRIGQTAHDFVQALGAAEVILTRARTIEGTPTIASRFLRRLDAFIGEEAANGLRISGEAYLQAARMVDAAKPMAALQRPEPRPPATLQPQSLSVTEISTLYRDPYTIYARHILELQPLEPLAQSIDARDKGTIIHEALALFIRETKEAWPAEPLERLLAIGRDCFAKVRHLEKVGAFWWPVFERVAVWFVEWEATRRETLAGSHVEIGGSMTIPLADGTAFRLRGRADRIDQLQTGKLAILDYKTGATASAEQIRWNNEPQLTLMAAMAKQGGFENIPKAEVETIGYVGVGSKPAFKPVDQAKLESSIEATAQKHIMQLQGFLSRLRSGEEAFVPRRKPLKQNDSGDYDHLARNREWMSGQEEAE